MSPIEGTFRKRHRTDSSVGVVRRPRPNRPRAIDIPLPIRAAPAAWAALTAQIQYAWTYKAAVTKIICDGTRSMHSEDLNSRIVTQRELLTPYCFPVHQRDVIVRSNPLPTFDSIPMYTRPHQSSEAITHIYNVFPMILTSSNAQERSPPPFNVPPTPLADSFNPILLPTNLSKEYHPLLRQPETAGIDDAARIFEGPLVVKSSVRAKIRASHIQFHEQDLAFAQDMGRLFVIAPQNLNKVHVDPECTVPHSLITEMYALMHESIIRHLLNTDYSERSTIVGQLNDFYWRLASANACADVVLLRALDACAILGGVELPCWPPNKRWRGAVFNSKSLPTPGIEPTDDGEQLLATIRQLERWGVPIWGFSISRANSRFDVTPEGLPSEDKLEEDMFQRLLHSVDTVDVAGNVERVKIAKTVKEVHTNDVLLSPNTGLPLGSQRLRLQHAIVALLDHNSPSHMNFASFSSISRDILGSTIWTGNRHEAALHPLSLDISQPMPWSRVRDAPRECAHCGVNIALFQIPLPWLNPDSSVATSGGEYALTEQIAGVSLVAAASGTWCTLEVDDFKKDDGSVVQQLAERFVGQGLCGWTFIQSGLQRKDANGKTIPHSRFTARFLFKQQHVLETVENSIKADYPDHERRSKDETNVRDDVLYNYSFFVHPHFADVVYAEPISLASRMQIMALAPSFDVIPASVGSADRALQVKQVVHSLRYFELFEIAKFPPLIAPPPSSSSSSPPPSSVGLDVSSCTPQVLRQLASSAVANAELSFMDICRMQRFACLIEVLAKDGSFMCQLFRSNGPYLKILRYLSTMICNTSPVGSSFAPRLNRVNVGPYGEAVRLTPGRLVEIVLNLDTSDSDIPFATEAKLAKWNSNVEKMWGDFSQKRSRSEKRQDKEQRRIAKGIAARTAGPSTS
jgi:hypothetical protein